MPAASTAARVAATTLVVAGALLSATRARAAAIVQTLHFPMLAGYGSEVGAQLNDFDASLGTLTAVTLNTGDTVTFNGSGAGDLHIAAVSFSLAGQAFSDETADRTGNGPTSAHQFTTLPASANAAFVGTGQYTPGVTLTNDYLVADAATLTVAATDTLTYTYTPAAPAAVPEPTGLAALAAGLLGLAVVARRRA